MNADDAIKRLEDMDRQMIDAKVRVFKQIANCMKRMANELSMEAGVREPYPEQTMNPHLKRPEGEDQGREW